PSRQLPRGGCPCRRRSSQIPGSEAVGHLGSNLAVAPSEITTAGRARADERLERILSRLGRKLRGNELGDERVHALPLAGGLCSQANPQFVRKMHGHS